MKKTYIIVAVITLIGMGISSFFVLLQPIADEHEPIETINGIIKLPEPEYDSETSIEKALLERRSFREYKDEPMTLAEVSQLLWAAQGITDPGKGYRATPSAGALYPLEAYVVIGNVEGGVKGVYRYMPHKHELVKVREGDVKDELTAAIGQTWAGEGSIIIVFSAVYERTTQKYDDRGIRYVHMEAGHAAQNVYLQAVSLNLGTAVIGAFKDDEVKRILNMPDEEHPLYIMPVGNI